MRWRSSYAEVCKTSQTGATPVRTSIFLYNEIGQQKGVIPISKHHLLWTRKNFNKGYAHKLRRALAYEIPDDLHVELHNAVPPIPPITEWQAKVLYLEYQEQPKMELLEALDWLVRRAPTPEFKQAMMNQELFLRCCI